MRSLRALEATLVVADAIPVCLALSEELRGHDEHSPHHTALRLAENFGKSKGLGNVADVSLAYAMLVGPVASRLQLPVLLTAHDDLPKATADVINEEDFEHVVIVGGTSSVSSDVSGDLTSAGVDTVTRVSGDSPAAASAELAKLATNGCRSDLGGVSNTTVALVAERGLPDGVAASPVLASSYRSGEMVPMLVVGNSLPSSVRDFLAATPQEDSAGNKLHMEIVAIGGHAAVTRGVMSAALAAAASAPALTVRIVSPTDWDNDGQKDDAPRVGETSFELHFSDDIAGDSDNSAEATVKLRARLLDVLRIGRVPAVLSPQSGDPAGVDYGEATTDCKPDTVTVNLASALTAGQSISIASTPLEFGAQADKRPLAGTSVTVVRKETSKPTFEIISIVGQSSFTVIAKDAGTNDTGLANGETLTDSEVTVSAGTSLTVSSVSGDSVSASDSRVTEHTFTVNMSRALTSSDRIKIAANAIKDKAGNGNSERNSPGPVTPTSNVTLSSLAVSSHYHNVQAKYAVPVALTGGNSADGGTEDVFFTAKPTGAAGGANGNGWTFDFRKASTYNANKPVGIEVFVNTAGKRAFITFANGKPKFSDLMAALRAHSTFNNLWEVSVDNVADSCVSADKALTVAAATTASGDQEVSVDKVRDGNTKMAIEARFSGYVQTVYSSELLADAFAATVARVSTATLSDIGLSGQENLSGPIRVARYVASTEDVTRLPRSGDRYDVAAATIADGYAADNGNTTVDESKNRAQPNRRIGSGATAPR